MEISGGKEPAFVIDKFLHKGCPTVSETMQFPLDSVLRGGVWPLASYVARFDFSWVYASASQSTLKIDGSSEVSLLVDQSRIA